MIEIDKLNLNEIKGKISFEDYERLIKHKPQTLLAAKRAGIK